MPFVGSGGNFVEIQDVARMEISAARRRALASVALNLALAVVKGVAGVASGSAALMGDALHSATDVLASAAAWVGLWLAGRRHPSFPYGLYKAETVATLVISIAVILAAYEIGRWVIFGTPGVPDVQVALPVAVGSFVVALAFGLYQLGQGKRLGSTALVADARDYLADSLSTLVVVGSLVGQAYGLHLERYAAGAVSLFVFWAGGSLLFRTLKDLMDAGMDPSVRREVVDFVERHPQVRYVERCIGRTAGGRFIINLDVVLRTASHTVADRVADRLEEDLYRQFPRVVMAHIRTHHDHGSTFRRMTPMPGPDPEAPVHFASAPSFCIEVVDAETGEVQESEVVENPHAGAERGKGLLVGRWLLSFRPDEVVVAHGAGRTAAFVLREAGVRLVDANGSVCEAEPEAEGAPEDTAGA
jgi:cation diffusion facilitator family transporter